MVGVAVNKTDQHALVLRDLYGGDKVTVASHQNRLLDLALGGQLGHVDPKQDIDPLLFVSRGPIGVSASVFESS